MQTKRRNPLKKNLLSTGYSYHYFPIIRKIAGLPVLPSDSELETIMGSSEKKLFLWTAGIQRNITQVAVSSKSPQRRGELIKPLAEKLETVNTQLVRRSLLKEGFNPDGTYPFASVLDADRKRVVVPRGVRTVAEQARLHGKAGAQDMIQRAFSGQAIARIGPLRDD